MQRQEILAPSATIQRVTRCRGRSSSSPQQGVVVVGEREHAFSLQSGDVVAYSFSASEVVKSSGNIIAACTALSSPHPVHASLRSGAKSTLGRERERDTFLVPTIAPGKHRQDIFCEGRRSPPRCLVQSQSTLRSQMTQMPNGA